MKQISSLAITSLALFAAVICSPSTVRASEVKLENKLWLATFDSDSGALTKLENKKLHWNIEQRPELGESFQLNALSPDLKDNYVFGRKQRAVSVQKLSANQVRLQWKDLQ